MKGYFKSRDDLLPFVGELLNEKILEFLREESKYIEKAAEAKEDSAGTDDAAAEDKTENPEAGE